MQGLVIDSQLRQYFRNRIIFLCRRARAGLSKKWDFLYYQVTAGKTHRIQKFILYAWKDHSTTIQLYTIPGGDCKIIKSPLPRKVPVRSMDLLCKFKWYFLIVSPGIYFYPPWSSCRSGTVLSLHNQFLLQAHGQSCVSSPQDMPGELENEWQW